MRRNKSMSAGEALDELHAAFSNSYPWDDLTPESDLNCGKYYALLVLTSEWKAVIDANGNHPRPMDFDEGEGLENSLNSWNFACSMLLQGYAATNPEECLTVLGPLLTKENSGHVLYEVAQGLQKARIRGLKNAKNFAMSAMSVIDPNDCEKLRSALAILHRGDDSAKRAYADIVSGLGNTCPELQATLSKCL